MSASIKIDEDKCTGCRICELICSFNKGGELNPKRSRIRVVKMDRVLFDLPVLCMQCGKAPCLESCQAGALTQDGDGVIHVKEQLCTGCEACSEACPVGAISIDPLNKVAIVCDLCNGSPLCVKWCPTGALMYNASNTGAPGAVAQRNRWQWASRRARPVLKKWGIPPNALQDYPSETESGKAAIAEDKIRLETGRGPK